MREFDAAISLNVVADALATTDQTLTQRLNEVLGKTSFVEYIQDLTLRSPSHPCLHQKRTRRSARSTRWAMGEMSDIVNAILYLDAAPFVTGEILHVDGGQSAGH